MDVEHTIKIQTSFLTTQKISIFITEGSP
jgi:hypothetical protein